MSGKRRFCFWNKIESVTFSPMLPRLQLFQNEWVTFAAFFGMILILIALSEILRSRLRWTTESSRKFVHILVGVCLLFSLFLFQSNTQPIILAIIFILINGAALKMDRFAAMHATRRKSFGTVYFPVAYLILVLGWWDDPTALVVALLLLTFADTVATVVGESVHTPDKYVVWQDTKSVQGSIAMFLMSIALISGGIIFVSQCLGDPIPAPKFLIPKVLFIAFLATAAEAASSRGSDNLSVPFITVIGLDLFDSMAASNEISLLLVWIVATLIMSFTATYFKSLTNGGALGATVIGIFVFGIGGLEFLIPMSAFFILSSILSRLGKKRKIDRKHHFGKGAQRDIVQVFANGGIPMLLAIWYLYAPSQELYIIYLASLAAATADTWGTEIGFFSRKLPRSFTTFKQIPTGSSGGVSIVGTLGSILGAAAIGGISYLFLEDVQVLIVLTAAGFGASLIDSFLGATVQANFECTECHELTELDRHCDLRANKVRGFRGFTNDTVNLLCTLSGAVMALAAMG